MNCSMPNARHGVYARHQPQRTSPTGSPEQPVATGIDPISAEHGVVRCASFPDQHDIKYSPGGYPRYHSVTLGEADHHRPW